MPGDAPLDQLELPCEIGMRARVGAKPDERPNHEDAHLHRPRAVEDRRGENGTVLGESPGSVTTATSSRFRGHNL